MDDLKQEDTEAIGNDPTLLLVDDDKPFLQRLARAMESRGFQVTTAESVEEGIAAVRSMLRRPHQHRQASTDNRWRRASRHSQRLRYFRSR